MISDYDLLTIKTIKKEYKIKDNSKEDLSLYFLLRYLKNKDKISLYHLKRNVENL